MTLSNLGHSILVTVMPHAPVAYQYYDIRPIANKTRFKMINLVKAHNNIAFPN
jgi:hypothetical protein